MNQKSIQTGDKTEAYKIRMSVALNQRLTEITKELKVLPCQRVSKTAVIDYLLRRGIETITAEGLIK